MGELEPVISPIYTGVKLFIGPKVLCLLYFEICTPEGRGGEKGQREWKFENKAHRTFDIIDTSTPVNQVKLVPYGSHLYFGIPCTSCNKCSVSLINHFLTQKSFKRGVSGFGKVTRNACVSAAALVRSPAARPPSLTWRISSTGLSKKCQLGFEHLLLAQFLWLRQESEL